MHPGKIWGSLKFHMTNMLFDYKSLGLPKPSHTVILFSSFKTTGACSFYFPSVDGVKLWVPNPNEKPRRRFLPTDAETTKTSFGVLDLEAGGFMIFSKNMNTFDI